MGHAAHGDGGSGGVGLAAAVALLVGLSALGLERAGPREAARRPAPAHPAPAAPAAPPASDLRPEAEPPRSPEALLREADGHHQEAEYFRGKDVHHRVAEAATRALDCDPRALCALKDRAEARASMGHDVAAIEDWQRLIELAPGGARWHRGLAAAWIHLGDVNRASPEAERALSLDPASAEAWHLRALIKLRKNDPAGAEADFDRALELEPDRVETRYQRSQLRTARGDSRGALEDLERFLALVPPGDPREAAARGAVGQLRASLGPR